MVMMEKEKLENSILYLNLKNVYLTYLGNIMNIFQGEYLKINSYA
jgi:hypothetical protein